MGWGDGGDGGGWGDPLVGSTILRRPAIQSPGYTADSVGWTINADGSVEFNSGVFRGTVTAGTFQGTDFIINASGAFFYSGVPAAGNLIYSIASVGGVDAFGNNYLQGAAGYTNQGQITSANSIATRSTQFSSLQGPLLILSPDLGTWNSGSLQAVTGNGHIILTAPQLPLDGGNGAVVTLIPASPANGANAQITATADKYAFTATNDTVNITTNGAVQVDPLNGGSATHAFIAGTIGSGSVNWYRGASNTWKTDDSVLLTDGNGVFVGSGYDAASAFASGRANLTDDAFSARITTDSNSRWVVTSNGIHHFGPGGATAIDTTIQREAAGVMGINGAWVGHGETWHTPTMGSGWATGPFSGTIQAIQYRQDAMDNLVIVGACHSTSATPAATLFTLPVGWRPAITQRSPGVVENNSGTPVVEFVEINSSGAVSLGTALAASGKDVYFQVCVPLGNIS